MGSGWPVKSAQKHTLTLPSGVKVEVKRPSLITMLSNGGLPTSLSVAVWKLAGNQYKPDVESGEDIRMIADQVAYFCAHTLLSIKVSVLVSGKVDERPETDITIGDDGIARGTARVEDIPDADKMSLFLYARGVELSDEERADAPRTEVVQADALATFPDGTEQPSGDAGRGGTPIRAEAVDVDRVAVSASDGG